MPIVVAINKIDKPGANPDNVKRELAELNLVPEDWGGQTVMVPVSAKKKQNLDQLLEMILLSTDILELKANPKRSASGTVLEAKLDRGRGPVATVLVQDGTLQRRRQLHRRPGGRQGRARSSTTAAGRCKSAGPSTPVEVLGLTSLPQPGDPFQVVADAAKARQIATFRQAQAKERALGAKGGRLTLESLKEQIAEGGVKELPLIVKADVQGSAEVLADTLTKLSDEKVKIRIIRSGVGAINESDVLLASASNAIIIGFNVRPDRNAQDIGGARGGRHPPALGHLQRDRGDQEGHGRHARPDVQGSAPRHAPKCARSSRCRRSAPSPAAWSPTAASRAPARRRRGCCATTSSSTKARSASLRRFKDDVSEVKSGFECGIGLAELQRRQGRRRHRGLHDGAGRRTADVRPGSSHGQGSSTTIASATRSARS